MMMDTWSGVHAGHHVCVTQAHLSHALLNNTTSFLVYSLNIKHMSLNPLLHCDNYIRVRIVPSIISFLFTFVLGIMGCSQKSFKLVWRCHQLLSGCLAKCHFSRVSRQSLRSLIIRVIMKQSWGLCRDLLPFALQLRKTQ